MIPKSKQKRNIYSKITCYTSFICIYWYFESYIKAIFNLEKSPVFVHLRKYHFAALFLKK